MLVPWRVYINAARKPLEVRGFLITPVKPIRFRAIYRGPHKAILPPIFATKGLTKSRRLQEQVTMELKAKDRNTTWMSQEVSQCLVNG